NTCGGVLISGGNSVLGGTNAGDRNVIAGNGPCNGLDGFGVAIGGSSPAQKSIYGNYIGVNAAGGPLGNEGSGVLVAGSNIALGGPNPGEGNVISNNHLDGVWVLGGASDVGIPGNKIGTDSSGTLAMGNLRNGVTVTGPAHDIAVGNAVN